MPTTESLLVGAFVLYAMDRIFMLVKTRNGQGPFSWNKVLNDKMDRQTLILEKQTDILKDMARDVRELRREELTR